MSSELGALVLAAYNPASWCEMENPRRRFLGYCSLATMLLIPHWLLPGTYLALPWYPLPLPPTAGNGEENLVFTPLRASPGNHGNPATGTRLAHPDCNLLNTKDPGDTPRASISASLKWR